MIPTTVSRRRFLATLLAAPAAALALTKVAAAKAPPTTVLQGPVDTHVSPVMPQRSWLVKGLAIKVPSNRYSVSLLASRDGPVISRQHDYIGDWNGTFKLEAGCSNPAYILADLYERTGAEPDWVVADKSVAASFASGPMVMSGMWQLLGPRLNWQLLYDYGVWCDELVTGYQVTDGNRTTGITMTDVCPPTVWWEPVTAPRLTVNTFVSTPEEMTTLRETLRMHCLSWQSTDPRYRTSYPGVGYPVEGRA